VPARKDLFGCPGESRWLARGIKLETYASSSPIFYLRLRCGRQNANTTLSLQLPMKFGNTVRVETSRYLTKIAILRRKADRKSARSKVLTAKHTASLQLLCTVGGDLASLRTEAKSTFFLRGTPLLSELQIRYAHPISLSCHQLYIAIIANGCGCTQGPFWLPWRVALVSQEN